MMAMRNWRRLRRICIAPERRWRRRYSDSYGTVVGDIKEVSKSYKEAKLALMSVRYSSVNAALLHTVLWELDV